MDFLVSLLLAHRQSWLSDTAELVRGGAMAHPRSSHCHFFFFSQKPQCVTEVAWSPEGEVFLLGCCSAGFALPLGPKGSPLLYSAGTPGAGEMKLHSGSPCQMANSHAEPGEGDVMSLLHPAPVTCIPVKAYGQLSPSPRREAGTSTATAVWQGLGN